MTSPTEIISTEVLTLSDTGTSTRDTTVLGAGFVAAVAVFLLHQESLFTATGLFLAVSISALLSVIDLREHRLPNRIVGPLAAGTTAWVVALGLIEGDPMRALVAIGWGCAATLAFFALHLLANLGMGDVKYAFPICVALGWFGWSAVQTALLVTCLTAGVVGMAVIVRGGGARYKVAYGPFMALGFVGGLVAASFPIA